MSDYNSIKTHLTELIAANTKLSADIIKPELNLEASGLDSFARIELILVIEEKFGIELTDSESANIATIDDLIKIIVKKA